MSDKVEYSRLLLKRSNTAGVTPTIPPVSATTLNQFTPTDLFVGEMFVNVEDDRAFVRTNNSIIEFSFSGGTSGSTVIPSLTQVLNSGNTTGGFDILFPSGSKPVYTGLASGATTQFLGLDASGNTIIVTGATGGSGTSGTSGTNGSSGTSGVSGLGLFLPLSGGTVTGNTTFTQSVFLTNLTSGGSSTFLTVDSDTGQIYTATGSTGTSGTSGTSGVNGTSGTSGVNGTSGTSGVNGTSGTSGVSGTSGSSGIDGTSGTSGVNGTSGTSGVSGTSGSSGVNGTSGSSGVDGTSGSSGVNGTSGSSGVNGTSGSSGVDGTSGSSGVSGTNGSSGVDGTSGTSGVGSSGTSGLSGVNGTSGTSGAVGPAGATFSGGSGNCITDLYVTNIHGCSPINVQDDAVFNADVFITNITSGGSSTFLTIDSDTGQLYTAQGAAGSSGTSGVNGTSGTSGTGGGGGGPVGCTHFAYPLATGATYNLSLTSMYQEMTMNTDFANRILAWPFVPGRNLSIKGLNIDFFNLNGNTAGRMKYLVYDNDDNNFLPKNLIYESTTITPAGFSIVQYSQDITLSAGTTYWLGTAFNTGMTPTYNMRSLQPQGMLTIGPPNETDGHGKMYKMAVSDTISFPTIPSPWVKPPSPFNFYGSTVMNNGYWGGTAMMPELRIKT